MARNPKLELGAINIRISEKSKRDYSALIQLIESLKLGIKVHGDTFLALSSYDTKTQIGVLSKYTQIDLDGDWFDTKDFGVAEPSKIDQIKIPENLRPNLSQFWFRLYENIHTLVFEVYSLSKSLSTRSCEKFFKEISQNKNVIEQFGVIEADIVKSFSEVDRLLSLPDLREVHITVRRPNPDDVGEDLSNIIEERLKEQNAREYEESLKTGSGESLEPNDRTKSLARLAAENGEVRIKSIVNGILHPQDTSNSPLLEIATHSPDDYDLPLFVKLSDKLAERIESARDERRAE